MTGLSLLVRDGRIAEIGSNIRASKHTEVLDYRNSAISPPFCDFHLHFFRHAPERSDEIGSALLSHGIATVFEGGSPGETGLKMKDLLRKSTDVRTSGQAIYRQGTYGKSIGRGVADMNEARELIGSLAREGVDYIKVVNSGILDPATGEITGGGFSREELSHIVSSAREHGLPVYCHANGDTAIADAVLSGVSAVVHGFSASRETLRLMKEKGSVLIPTLYAFSSLLPRFPDTETGRRMSASVASHLRTVGLAAEIGVTILPGSDAGTSSIPYGESYAGELGLLEQAGVPRERLLLSSVNGPIRQHSPATFIVLDGLTVKAVFLNGRQAHIS